MACTFGGWNLWESEKNLQYLLDSCETDPELKVSSIGELQETTQSNKQAIKKCDLLAGRVEAPLPPRQTGIIHNCTTRQPGKIDPIEIYLKEQYPVADHKTDAKQIHIDTKQQLQSVPVMVETCVSADPSTLNNVGVLQNKVAVEIAGNQMHNNAVHNVLPIIQQLAPEYINTNQVPMFYYNVENHDSIPKSNVPIENQDSMPKSNNVQIENLMALQYILPDISKRSRQKEKAGFVCHICGKVMVLKGNLKNHILSHTSEKPFICSICSAVFKRKGDLKQHQLNHSDVRPFQCSICSWRFKRKGDLKEHYGMHIDGKPYSCTTCGNKFNQQSTLRTHILTHSGEQPFQCDVCDKRFSVKNNLTAHKLTHSGEQPFNCTRCAKKFSLKGNLKRHTELVHEKD